MCWGPLGPPRHQDMTAFGDKAFTEVNKVNESSVSWGWILIQSDWYLYKKRRGQTHKPRGSHAGRREKAASASHGERPQDKSIPPAPEILGAGPPALWENMFLIFECCLVCGTLLWQPKQTTARGKAPTTSSGCGYERKAAMQWCGPSSAQCCYQGRSVLVSLCTSQLWMLLLWKENYFANLGDLYWYVKDAFIWICFLARRNFSHTFPVIFIFFLWEGSNPLLIYWNFNITVHMQIILL